MCPIAEDFVMLSKAMVVVVVVMVTLAWWTASEGIPVTETSPFCSQESNGFICTFFNITQDVEVVGSGPVAAGVASQHPAISCPCCPVDVSNSTSANTTVTSDLSHATQPSPNTTEVYVTPTSLSSRKGVSAKPRNISRTFHRPREDCPVNASVVDSSVRRVQGHFVAAEFDNSEVVNLDGVYMYLGVKSTVVSNMSLSGRMIEVENAKIWYVSHLKAEEHLQMYRSELGTVGVHGLQLLSLGREAPQGPHILRDMTIEKLEARSLVIGGAKAEITNVTVGWLDRDAIKVGTRGVLILTDATLNCRLYYCLTLERGARLVLRNMTINDKTITKMDLVANATGNSYPLFALVSKDDREPLEMSFPWYWMVIMAACGIIAGVVIGSALSWKRPSIRAALTSTLTLADLLTHDRMQENNVEAGRDNFTDPSTHPTFIRQDSGLTSSSFASFMPSQTANRERDASIGYSNSTG